MLNARRKFKGAVIAALAGRSRLSTSTHPKAEGTVVKPLRLSYFKGLRRLQEQDIAVKHDPAKHRNGKAQHEPKGLQSKNEERQRQKSPNQKDRANFVNIKFKVFQ